MKKKKKIVNVPGFVLGLINLGLCVGCGGLSYVAFKRNDVECHNIIGVAEAIGSVGAGVTGVIAIKDSIE